ERLVLRTLEDMERESLCGSRADARQPSQLRDEVLHGRAEHRAIVPAATGRTVHSGPVRGLSPDTSRRAMRRHTRGALPGRFRTGPSARDTSRARWPPGTRLAAGWQAGGSRLACAWRRVAETAIGRRAYSRHAQVSRHPFGVADRPAARARRVRQGRRLLARQRRFVIRTRDHDHARVRERDHARIGLVGVADDRARATLVRLALRLHEQRPVQDHEQRAGLAALREHRAAVDLAQRADVDQLRDEVLVYRPGRRPPRSGGSMPFIFASTFACAERSASFAAAITRSARRSGSFGSIAFGSMRSSFNSPAALATTVTTPPPADASAVSRP